MTMPHLCATFERLLIYHGGYDVFARLLTLGVHPLTIAFPWLRYGFESYLDPEQLLLLWDRVVAYGDIGVGLLPVLAVAVFAFRSKQISDARTLREAKEALEDGSCLRVIPLLQGFLFPEAFR